MDRHRLDWLVLLAMVAPGFAWAYLDHRVWPWDQAQYAEVTLRTLAAFEQGVDVGLEAMMSLLDFRAPGLTWLSAPYAVLARMLDRAEVALLCATLTWQAGTLLACYWSARLVSQSRLVAVAVGAFIASTPVFVGMNHQFLVEPLQTLAVALSFLLALRARELSSEALLAALLAVSALAMGAKASSPLYCTLPLGYAAWVLASRGSFTPIRATPLFRVSLFIFAAGGLALVTWWYVSNFDETLDNVRQSTVGSLALNYGKPGDFAVKLGQWLSSFAAAVVVGSPVAALAAAAGACAGAGFQKRHTQAGERARTGWIVAAAAVHLGAALITYSLQINDDTRFLEPLLPIVAILLAWLCSLRWRGLASSVLIAVALANFVLAYAYALGLAAPAGVRHPWLYVVERDDTRRDQLQEIVALTCDPDKGFAVNVVGVDYAWLNHFSADFYAAAAQDGRPACDYTHLGYAVSDAERALRTLAEEPRNYYIGMRPEKMPPRWDRHLNLVSAAVFAEVATSEDWEAVGTIDDTVVIFRSRRRPESAK